MKDWGNLAAPILITAIVAAMLGGDVMVAVKNDGRIVFGVIA